MEADGSAETYAEGLGIATGIAFDAAGDLYVGDRSGTIFKIRTANGAQAQETFVFATLEPSISAYHLAFDSKGTLYVTDDDGFEPVDSRYRPEWQCDGVLSRTGRAQGMALMPRTMFTWLRRWRENGHCSDYAGGRGVTVARST